MAQDKRERATITITPGLRKHIEEIRKGWTEGHPGTVIPDSQIIEWCASRGAPIEAAFWTRRTAATR